MLRVDQAGEYGATRIYAGQLAVMGDRHPDARVIRRMAQQEERHREILDKLLLERGVRPTALQPLWEMAGFALGAARSEEHTSELQSLMRISYAVFCLKKKKAQQKRDTVTHNNYD